MAQRKPRAKPRRLARDRQEGGVPPDRQLRPPGLAEVERARADGRWDNAYEGARTAAIPGDLQRELDTDPTAAAAFAGLDSRNRYAIIWRLNDAKRPETRARRLADYLGMLRRGERLHE